MHSVATHPHHQAHITSKRSIVFKLTIAASLLVLAYTQLNSGLMAVLILATGLVLAMMYRVDNINATDEEQHKRAAKPSSYDGGTYNRKRKINTDENNAAASNDGGSFERSSLKHKDAA